MATLSAKLAPNLSPRTSRRHSEDLGPIDNNKINQQQQRGPGQSFLDSLNAKLAQQHLTSNNTQQQHKANRIRQFINSKAQVKSKLKKINYPLVLCPLVSSFSTSIPS